MTEYKINKKCKNCVNFGGGACMGMNEEDDVSECFESLDDVIVAEIQDGMHPEQAAEIFGVTIEHVMNMMG